jgi:hypothetical protein
MDTPSAFLRRGGLLAIAFAVLALAGLALWFTGANMPEADHSAAELEQRANSVGRALAGAVVLICSMVALIGFARWLTARYPGGTPMTVGAAILALGGLTHIVENVLVIRLYGGDISDGDVLWDVISAMSFTAFALLGFGALIIALGLDGPGWLKTWGVISGCLGIVAGLSGFVTALSFIAGPFNISLLGWLIVVGLRRDGALTSDSPGPHREGSRSGT